MAAVGSLIMMGCRPPSAPDPMAKLAPLVQPQARWHSQHLADFLQALPPPAMLTLQRTIGLASAQDGIEKLQGPTTDTLAMQISVLRLSTHFLGRVFKNPAALDYHEVVSWVAGRSGVASSIVKNASTYLLERKLLESIFIEQWNQLSVAQREKVLDGLDLGTASLEKAAVIADKAAIAALGGAAALATLSTTVALSGFAFYTTLSATIAAVAAAAGVTVPFAVYAGASTVVAVLSGPVGWVIAGAAALGGLALLRPDAKRLISFVLTLHLLKVDALKAAGFKTEIA